VKEITIVTYPRSGSNYLQNLLFNHSGNHIKFTHKTDNSDHTIITIARDPFESIHSYVTMRKHYHPNEGYEKRYNNEYIEMYNFLYVNANIVINYKDLTQSPIRVVEEISSILKFKKSFNNFSLPSDNKELSYLLSSKTSHEYKNEHFKIKDVHDCYDSYKKLLSKSLDLTNYQL
jgi:hypothetical protein